MLQTLTGCTNSLMLGHFCPCKDSDYFLIDLWLFLKIENPPIFNVDLKTVELL